MDVKLKKFLLDLQRRSKEMAETATRKGKETTPFDMVLGTWNMANFNNQLLLKLLELVFERDGQHLTLNKKEEETSETVH